ECVVIGAMDFLEIWDAEAWAHYQADTESAFADASDDFLDGLL
ncbi:MAG: cell division/cell wall cluster transcriptional repressor MraZ, partial [Corynebacterium matruchotii]